MAVEARIMPAGRRSMLKLAQRMTDNFCAGVCTSLARKWSHLANIGSIGEDVRMMTRQSMEDPNEQPDAVLSAVTFVWLLVSPHHLFDFLRNETLCIQWDILSNGGSMQEMAHVAKGQDEGNVVSLRSAPVGGTIAGLALGSTLSNLKAKVHAFSVCDDPDYFYNYCQGLLDGLQAGVDMHDIVNIQDAKGLGYAISTAEELQFVKDTAAETGVILDPVYSGKAAYALLKDISANPTKWKGRKILFIHTGGLLGLFDKFEQLAPMIGNWGKMELGESIPRKDGIGKMF